MFGSRPDIFVIRGKGNVGLIAIEIKQSIGETKLRNFCKVIGHAYDHAMGMKAFNVGTDIVLVTSFEESFLGSLTKADLMQDADNVVETSSDSTQGNPDGPGVQDDPIRGISSPNQGTTSRNMSHRRANPNAENGTFKTDGISRRLHVSKNDFKAHELVKLIYTAITIEEKSYSKFEKKIYKLEHGETYHFPRALGVVHDSDIWQWGDVEAIIGEVIYHHRRRPRRVSVGHENAKLVKTYYIVGCLGQGSTSNVIQAINGFGNLVAIKVFVDKTDGGGKILKTNEFRDKAKKKCDEEKKALLACYDFLKESVHVIKFCGLYAVVMPIFEPIPKDDRNAKLKDVKEVLLKMKKKGKKFLPSDVRFRHVGMIQDNLVLFDFANLVPINYDDEDYSIGSDSEPEETDAVKQQMKIFTQRCKENCPMGTCGLFLSSKLS